MAVERPVIAAQDTTETDPERLTKPDIVIAGSVVTALVVGPIIPVIGGAAILAGGVIAGGKLIAEGIKRVQFGALFGLVAKW